MNDTTKTPRAAPDSGFIPGLRTMSDVVAQPVNWLWYPYIPLGKLTMLEGDPGLGKSWISCDIAARVSTGTPFPGQDGARMPSKALMMSAEDGLEDTIRPRLDALGGDLSRIQASDIPFTLTEKGFRQIEATVAEAQATIVFIDPLVGYMGGKVDMNKANEVREIMAALAQLARRTGSAIVGVRHLRKMGGANAKYRGLGSIDFTAAARSALQVGETKHGNTFMEHIKHNLSPAGDTLGYRVYDGKLEWTGAVDFEKEERKKTNTTPRGANAKDFLLRVLAAGPLPVDEVRTLAAANGITDAAIFKAKQGVVVSVNKGRNWEWGLASTLIPVHVEVEREEVPEDLLQEALNRLGRGKA